MKKKKVLIVKKFEEQGKEIAKYISENSSQNAKEFAKEVDGKIMKIIKHPTAYPPELYLPTKKNWYRFTIVKKRWKIIFKITNKLLVFLDIIHTSRHPHEIQKLRTNKYH